MNIKTVLQEVTEDRVLIASCFVFALICIAAVLLLVFRIHPSELNTQIRYSAFGVAHIYSNAWYYLLPTVLFGLFILPLHIVIAIKLHIGKRKYMARLFMWLSIVVVTMAIFIGSAILGLAAI